MLRSLEGDLRYELRQNSRIHHLVVRQRRVGLRHDESEVTLADQPMITIPMQFLTCEPSRCLDVG